MTSLNSRYGKIWGLTALGPISRKSRNFLGAFRVTILSQKRRRLEARNFAVILIFTPSKTYEKKHMVKNKSYLLIWPRRWFHWAFNTTVFSRLPIFGTHQLFAVSTCKWNDLNSVIMYALYLSSLMILLWVLQQEFQSIEVRAFHGKIFFVFVSLCLMSSAGYFVNRKNQFFDPENEGLTYEWVWFLQE